MLGGQGAFPLGHLVALGNKGKVWVDTGNEEAQEGPFQSWQDHPKPLPGTSMRQMPGHALCPQMLRCGGTSPSSPISKPRSHSYEISLRPLGQPRVAPRLLPGQRSGARAGGGGMALSSWPNLPVPVLDQSDQTLQLGGARDDEVPLQLRETGGVLARVVVAVDEVDVDLRRGPPAGAQLAWRQGGGHRRLVSQNPPGAN